MSAGSSPGTSSRNDEILSYIWRGTMVHEDSAGYRIPLSPRKLMMMNAGRGFWHEESTPSEPVEMLQIFVFRKRQTCPLCGRRPRVAAYRRARGKQRAAHNPPASGGVRHSSRGGRCGGSACSDRDDVVGLRYGWGDRRRRRTLEKGDAARMPKHLCRRSVPVAIRRP
jgi:hypothetical protein